LPGRLRDAFREAGAGWQNTATNDFPLLRFDQVWVSEHWRVNRLSVKKSEHSDHRTVVCDLIRETGRGREAEAARSSGASPRR
jgi:endonuclease/exonuclease/phosphatase (EEP) superfamily protein YafD